MTHGEMDLARLVGDLGGDLDEHGTNEAQHPA